MRYLIKDATVLKDNQQTTGVDLLIENGVLLDMGSKLSDPNAKTIEGEDLWVFPGFCDIGAQAKDPGYEHREDIQSLQKTGATSILLEKMGSISKQIDVSKLKDFMNLYILNYL